LLQYDQHVKCHCFCEDPASASCEKCKPYSLKKCCKALPHYTEAITAEVGALQKSRRDELEHVVRALSDPAATAAAGAAASQAPSSSRVKTGGAAKPTALPPARAPAMPIAQPEAPAARPLAAASPAHADQHEDEAVASREPSSLAESASAVQSEVDPKAAKFCCWFAGAVFSSAA
jgi:hypothetical protein